MTKSPLIERSPLMEEYEQETGKLAIWKGEISNNFKKWKIRKMKEEKKKEKLQLLSQSKIDKRKWRKETRDGRVSGKDYDHL
ncbi:MAG: hypothetical protein ACFFC3_09935, partial [Candidatus Odinarchaeota archaeon]